MDDALEAVATFIWGPLPEGERRPGLAVKLFVFGLLAALIALGAVAASLHQKGG